MTGAYICLYGKDKEYLKKLCDYLQTHRVMRCRYRICSEKDMEEDLILGKETMLILEGDDQQTIYDRYRGRIPLLWLVEGSRENDQSSMIWEKYQSARKIGEQVAHLFHHFYEVSQGDGSVNGVFSLGMEDGLEQLCLYLKDKQEKALVVNLEFFTLFPGQEDFKYMNLSDLVMNDTSEIFQEEFPPYEISEGIYGIQCPTCPDDWRDILHIHNLLFLQEYGKSLGVYKIFLYFGHELLPWFPFAYACHELLVLCEGTSDRELWFRRFWESKAEGVPFRWIRKDRLGEVRWEE